MTGDVRPMKQILLVVLAAIATKVYGEDSVVLGRGISNEYASDLPCSKDSICMNSMYMWTFAAKRTIVGPEVKGKVRFLAAQHTDATPKFVKSVELFVLRPIDDKKVAETSGAQYYLLSLSPRYENGTYCISVNPEEVGLRLQKSDVSIDRESNYYCFKKSRL